jgi:uncharacterized protein YkwD
LVDCWKRSPKHRALLLDRRYDKAGVGVAREGGLAFLQQLFSLAEIR